jgi:hypothetical protein
MNQAQFLSFLYLLPSFFRVPIYFNCLSYRQSSPHSFLLVRVKTVTSPLFFRSRIPLSPSLLPSIFLSLCSLFHNSSSRILETEGSFIFPRILATAGWVYMMFQLSFCQYDLANVSPEAFCFLFCLVDI